VSDELVRAAKNRHDTATGKAEAALREMSSQRLPVTFAAVARRAGVSTDFLYGHPGLRSKITSMRSSTIRVAEPRPEADAADSTSAAVRALSGRLKELSSRHRADVSALEQALAAAHGENLLRRRRLAAYED
jgi:hypothetical protein